MKKMLRALGVLFLSTAVGMGAATSTYADESNGPQDSRESRQTTDRQPTTTPIPIDLLLLLLSMIR